MKAIIEIPKGCDRRIHLQYDKSGFIDLGPTKEKIPVNEGIMPVHYGFIADTLNAKEGDEVDVLVFSNKDFKTGDEVEVRIIGLIKRADEDDKVIAVDDSLPEINQWADIPEAERKSVEEFFSYHHPIVAIVGKAEAEEYITSCLVE